MRFVLFAQFLSISAVGAPIQLDWRDDILTVSAERIPGRKVETRYLEAFCRTGSTHRKWEETVIPHTTRLVSASGDKTRVELETIVDGGVTVKHEIRAHSDRVTFDLVITNTTDKPVDIDWAQPCIRVGDFTGRDKEDYIAQCFIFTGNGPTMLNHTRRMEEAIYRGGQVYVPRGIDPADVNPRPLSPDVPTYNLIGCVSSDRKWLLATAWDRTQELFQGVITCIHADFRIGGLGPVETKRVRGAMYIVPNDVNALLKRYEAEFPER